MVGHRNVLRGGNAVNQDEKVGKRVKKERKRDDSERLEIDRTCNCRILVREKAQDDLKREVFEQ